MVLLEAGGHSKEILKLLDGGTLVCIDIDIEAINKVKDVLKDYEKNNEVILVQENHENIPEILNALGINKVDGILLDLGVSSYQIDNGERGFSYMHNGKLDMRMDNTTGITACDIINEYSLEELIRIFKEYGEEKFANKIAKEIVTQREKKKIETTFELNQIIEKVKPYTKKGHKSKQVFQALRIEVNKEIVNLEDSVKNMIDILKNRGRIAIITFHSLEDKAIKKVFKEKEGKCTCPKDLPVCVCGYKSFGKNLTKKAIIPNKEEILENTRSKSAKLRVFERVE
jgi:S-adenosyl-methyltransferase mraW